MAPKRGFPKLEVTGFGSVRYAGIASERRLDVR
jgi:hypothetical protein